MNVEVLSPQSTIYHYSQASVVITILKPGHLLISIFGYNDGEIGPPIYRAMDDMIALVGHLVCYMDSREQSGISSEERHRTALWAKAQGERFKAAHLLFRSRLIQLALVTGNLVARKNVKAYTNQEIFERAIKEEIPEFDQLPDFRTKVRTTRYRSPRSDFQSE